MVVDPRVRLIGERSLGRHRLHASEREPARLKTATHHGIVDESLHNTLAHTLLSHDAMSLNAATRASLATNPPHPHSGIPAHHAASNWPAERVPSGQSTE